MIKKNARKKGKTQVFIGNGKTQYRSENCVIEFARVRFICHVTAFEITLMVSIVYEMERKFGTVASY